MMRLLAALSLSVVVMMNRENQGVVDDERKDCSCLGCTV